MHLARWTSLTLVAFAVSAGMAAAGHAQNAADLVGQRSSRDGDRSPRFFMATATARVPMDVARTPVLIRRVALDLDNVSVKEALAIIAEKAGLELTYSLSAVPSTSRIRLRVDEITVAAALTDVLLRGGADVDIVFTKPGHATLVKRPAAPAVGIIAGRVTEEGTNMPVAAVQVTVVGIGVTRYTDDKGQYRLPGVPAGALDVTVRRLGFNAASRRVQVADGETATLDFVMVHVPTALSEVVTTATGERSRVEVGNSIGTIKADSLVPTTLIRNVSDLLTARTPGVMVSNTTGAVGAPSKIRIRGISSIQLNNDPIIILDGARLSWLTTNSGKNSDNTSQTNTGSQYLGGGYAPSRLDDIDPNTIESIDVLRGPSAATLYGTDAANGVIVIKTKKGAAGNFRLNVLADNGTSTYPGSYPAEWYGWGRTATGAITNSCSPMFSLQDNYYGHRCQQDSVVAFNGQNDPNLTGLGTGTTRNASVNLSGGSPQLQQFLSLRGSDQVGIARMSDVEQRRITIMRGAAPPSWMTRPNAEQDVDGTSRTTLRVGSNLDLQLSVNGVYRTVRNNGDQVYSGSTYLGSWDTLSNVPAEYLGAKTTGTFKRGFVSANSNYVPLSWLTLNATVGGDYTLRTDNVLQQVADCTALLQTCTSTHSNDRSETFVTTMNVGAQLSFAPRSWLALRTALGEQYSRTTFYELMAGNNYGTNLAFGTQLLTPSPIAISASQLYMITENRDQSATAGYYVEQTAAIRERLFLTAALRQDAASAFGPSTNHQLPTYPKFSLSWLLSDEAFFPYKSLISSFRVRTAYGHSGNQASQRDILPNYTTRTTAVDNTPAQGIVLSQIPNAALKPERTTELEGGFDLSLLSGERVHIEATLYRKLSEDAIIDVAVPGSFGATVNTRRQNLGSVENRGEELAVTVKVLDARAFGWDVSVNYTKNANKLVHINSYPRQVSNNSVSFVPGYPVYGYWGNLPAAYYDANGDGILEANEVSMSSGTPGVRADAAGGFVFIGPSYPKGEITYNNGFTFLSGALRVNAQLDQVNNVVVADNGYGGSSRCVVDPAICTLRQQAQSIGTLRSAFGGYASGVSWLRFTELSATYNLPRATARRLLRAQSAAVTFAGRNLALWTNYQWKDPGVGTLSDAYLGGDAGTSYGQPQNWTLRFNLGF